MVAGGKVSGRHAEATRPTRSANAAAIAYSIASAASAVPSAMSQSWAALMIVSFLSRVGVAEVSSWQQLYTGVTTPLESSSIDRFGAPDTRRRGRPRDRPPGPRRLSRWQRRAASGIFTVDFQRER